MPHYKQYKNSAAHTEQFRDFITTHQPCTITEIQDALGWVRGRVFYYINHFRVNLVDFRDETSPRGYAIQTPLYSFKGKHLGGTCERCGGHTHKLPKARCKGTSEAMMKICRSCRSRELLANCGKDENGHYDFNPEPLACDPVPLNSRPGSKRREAELTRRVELGLELWNVHDRVCHDDPLGFRSV